MQNEAMSLTKELRISLTESDHAFLNAMALAAGTEMQAIVRDLIGKAIDAKRREVTVLARIMGGDGAAAASRRNGDV